jgi:hypothetical protein
MKNKYLDYISIQPFGKIHARVNFDSVSRSSYGGDQSAAWCEYILQCFTSQRLIDDLEPVGLVTNMQLVPANESIQVTVVGALVTKRMALLLGCWRLFCKLQSVG